MALGPRAVSSLPLWMNRRDWRQGRHDRPAQPREQLDSISTTWVSVPRRARTQSADDGPPLN
eukprot:4548071-Pyramimonas_sp.AAC.1